MSEWETLAKAFTEVSRRLLEQSSAQHTLEVICDLAVESVGNCDDAGVTLVHSSGKTADPRIETPASYGELAETGDVLQYSLREGPCLTAIREQEIVDIPDIGAETRWPRFTPRVAELGAGSMLSFRLFAYENRLGVLNLYSRAHQGFDNTARHVATLVASHAAVALAAALQHDQLRAAITSRQVIGEAVGILMERKRMTSEQAFDELRRASNDRNVKLRQLAEHVVETGEGPSGR